MRTRRELLESLTVERFTHHQRVNPDGIVNTRGPDWWAAYDRVGLAESIYALPDYERPLISHPTGKAMA